MLPDELVQVLEAVEELRNLMAALLERQKVEKLFKVAAAADNLCERTEVGPEGGSVTLEDG